MNRCSVALGSLHIDPGLLEFFHRLRLQWGRICLAFLYHTFEHRAKMLGMRGRVKKPASLRDLARWD